MTLVAGVDSSTQSCKVVDPRRRDRRAGARRARAPHPDGTEVDPAAWWARPAGGDRRGRRARRRRRDRRRRPAARHGRASTSAARVIRPALLWNDTRSAAGGRRPDRRARRRRSWADAVGSVPVASFTVTKLRWLREHEPENAARVGGGVPAARLADLAAARQARTAPASLADLVTDRSDASGTGYFAGVTGRVPPRPARTRPRPGRRRRCRGCSAPAEAGRAAPRPGRCSGPGAGDNAAAALGLGARPGDVVVSLGTSGRGLRGQRRARPPTRPAPSPGSPTPPASFLPLVCTLNAARVLDADRRLLGVDHDRARPAGAAAPAGRRRAGAGALLRGRAHAEPARRHRRAARPDPGHHDPAAPGPGRGRGHALRARRRPRRAARPGRPGATGCS